MFENQFGGKETGRVAGTGVPPSSEQRDRRRHHICLLWPLRWVSCLFQGQSHGAVDVPQQELHEPTQPSNDILLRIYETERRDEQNTSSLIIAITTGSLAYLTGSAVFLSQPNKVQQLPIPILLAAPFPLFILSGYVTFQYAASRLRQSYLVYIENKLSPLETPWTESVKVPGFMTLHQGLFSELKSRLLWPFALLLSLTFAAHFLVVLGLTSYVIVSAAKRTDVTWSNAYLWATIVAYSLMTLVNLYALWQLLRFTMRRGKTSMLGELRKAAENAAAGEFERWKPH
jgi:hypothetical protein